MYHPTSRVLTVLELLQARPYISGPELAQRLEVNERTVRHYITILQDLGIPVEARIGRYGGYTLRPGFKLPPLMFTDDEIVALSLGLATARKSGLKAVVPTIESVVAKIERVLPVALRQQSEALQSAVVLDSVPSVAIDKAVLALLSLAVQQQQRVKIVYADKHSQPTERYFDPYGIAQLQGYWYTVGYCHLRQGVRIFRLDRIASLARTSTDFERPADFDCIAYIKQTIREIPDLWEVVVETTATPASILQVMPETLVNLEQTAEGVTTLRAWVNDLEWLARLLVAVGGQITVRQPADLKRVLANLAYQILAMANN